METVAGIQKLLDDYIVWIKDKTTLREVNGSWVEITTPYLDRHNDALQIYAKRENGGYILTDDRYTIHDLEASGCVLNTGKRQDLLKLTLNGFGIKLNDDAGNSRHIRNVSLAKAQSDTGNAGGKRSFLPGTAHGRKLVLRRCCFLA